MYHRCDLGLRLLRTLRILLWPTIALFFFWIRVYSDARDQFGGLPFHDHAGRCLSIDIILGPQSLGIMDQKSPLWVSDDLLIIFVS